ncbi:MAG: DUF2283 domain-containing protein [bacterium]
MKIDYYNDTDTLYITLSDKPSIESEEISKDIVMDLDQNNQPVGFEIEHARQKVNLNSIIFNLGNIQLEKSA